MITEILVICYVEEDCLDIRKDPQVTDARRIEAKKVGEQFGPFHIAVTTSVQGARETARLISGIEPVIDDRAGSIDLTQEGRHCFRIEETILADPQFGNVLWMSGIFLILLLMDMFQQLQDGEKALIVSHALPMLAAERKLQGVKQLGKRFEHLEGFRVNETIKIERLGKSDTQQPGGRSSFRTGI